MPLYHPLCLQKDGLQKLQPWIPVVEDLAPEVLILVCDRVYENGQFFCSACGLQKTLSYIQVVGDTTSNLCCRSHQTWSAAVVFGSCIWARRTQSSGAPRWGWWVSQMGEMSSDITQIYISILCVLIIFSPAFTLFCFLYQTTFQNPQV